MESRSAATMAKASRTGDMPPCRCSCLPEEIIIWEILVRLPPKHLLRCRAVCLAWRRATSTRDFLMAHHGHQPSLPLVWGEPISGSEHGGARYEDFLAFDHRAADAQLQPVARLGESYRPVASCDGLLILSKSGTFSVCNPVTREHAPLQTPWDFSIYTLLGMYLHRPTGEYRLLLLPKGETGCYVFTLGSDQPPKYIQGPDAASGWHSNTPILVRDSLHWFPSESRLILVFDTTTESFRQMPAPLVCNKSNIFEKDGTLGICNVDDTTKTIDIWVLQNYQGEVWKNKFQFKLPVAKIMGQLVKKEGTRGWYVGAVSVHGDILLLLSVGEFMFHINTGGELVNSFRRDGQHVYTWDLRFKHTLVHHNFLTTLEGYAVNASPFL